MGKGGGGYETNDSLTPNRRSAKAIYLSNARHRFRPPQKNITYTNTYTFQGWGKNYNCKLQHFLYETFSIVIDSIDLSVAKLIASDFVFVSLL